MRSIGGFPVHNYGMDRLARGIEIGAERYRMQKEQEEKNRAELVKLMEEKKTVAFDQFSKILELQDKYPEQAAHFSKLAQQRAEILGIPFDPATFTNSADQKKALRSQVIGELSATLEAGMQNPTDNAAIKTAELFRRAAKLGIKSDELDVYKPLYTDLMKRVQESRTREHAGFDAQGKPVYKMGGKLMYGPNQPYEGGPLQPTTKAAPTASVRDYVDSKGNVIPVNVNDPRDRAKIQTMGLRPYEKESTEKAGQNWMLPNKTTVISYDGGRTYNTPNGPVAIPPNAIKVPGGATLTELNMAESKRQAAGEGGEETPTSPGGISPKGASLKGTGPYATAMAAFDAVAGGLGLDTLIGKNGLFPETADARQYLRSVKQIGKAALMNSSRGAIWEQQRIDELFPDPEKIFTNPRLEARKFNNLMDVLVVEKAYNNQAIMAATNAKEIEKYREANNEINRLVELIREPQGGGGLSPEDKALIDKWVK